MARNGSGTYNLPAGNPVTTGTTISSTWANSTLSDMATALTGSVASDGQTTPSANLPMGTFAHTNVGNATVRTMYASAGQVQDGGLTYLTSVSGADTITAVGAVGMTAYATGQKFTFIAAGANTGAATININSLGAKAITKNGATALAAGDIASGVAVEVFYDGTQFQLLNSSVASVSSFSAGTTGLTPSTSTAGAVTLAGTLAAANGGTGLTSPGTSGNILTSNGTAWISATPATTTAYRIKLLLSGTTYTKPSDVKSLYAFVYGATGGTTNLGGGGGQGYSETYYASPASSYSYTIGAAGVSSAAGGTTTFGAMTVTSSAGVSTTTGSAGGAGSGGDFNATGGTGGNGSGLYSGGAGGAGSRAGNGGNGGDAGASLHGGGGGTGGNAGTSSPTATAQGAAATAKAAGALTLPWATAGEFFDGGGTNSIGAYAITGFVINTVSQTTRAFNSAGVTLFALGTQVSGASQSFGVNSNKGLVVLVEVI